MAFVGKKFPDLNVDAMNEMGDTFKVNILEEAVNNKKKVVLFWYPKDFTFVCPTELHAFQSAMAEFEKRNVQVIACSTDATIGLPLKFNEVFTKSGTPVIFWNSFIRL